MGKFVPWFRTISVVLFFSISGSVSAQKAVDPGYSARWDSIKGLLRESFFHGSLPVAKTYAVQLYDLSNQVHNDSLKIVALGLWGVVETDPQLTTDILERADSAAAAYGNLQMRIQVLSTLITHLHATGNIKGAYVQTRVLMNIAETTGDSDALEQNYMNLSQLYAAVQDYPKTIDALYHLRDILPRNNKGKKNQLLSMRMSETYLGLGRNYSLVGNQDSALFYIQKGLAQAKKDTIIGTMLRGYVELAAYHGRTAETQAENVPQMKAALDSASVFLSQGDWGLRMFFKRVEARYHLLNGSPQRCIAIVDSLAPDAYKNNDFTGQYRYEELLYKAYEKLNNTTQAYKHFKLFSVAKDSIDQQQIRNGMAIYEVDKQVHEREIENLKLSKQSELLAFRIKWLSMGIGIATLLSIIIAVFGFQWRRQARRNARLNQALQKSEQSLLQSNSRLDRFAGSVSHDLLANLDILLSSANAVSEKTENLSAMQFFYNQAQQSARRMKNYCLEILESARKNQPDAQIADLEKLVRQVESQFLNQIENSGVQINKGLLPVISAEPALLHQALQNLMSNALKYGISLENTPKFYIRTNETNSGWEIRFSDNGPGVPTDIQAILLKQALPPRTESETPSNGIGLYMTKQSLETAGYDLRYETSEEGGATFCISVPKHHSN